MDRQRKSKHLHEDQALSLRSAKHLIGPQEMFTRLSHKLVCTCLWRCLYVLHHTRVIVALVMFRFKIWNAPSPEAVLLSKVSCSYSAYEFIWHMNSYDIWILIFWKLCNHSCPWNTMLSSFGVALTLWLQKTLKEGWLTAYQLSPVMVEKNTKTP
jgi:hypothetical protein